MSRSGASDARQDAELAGRCVLVVEDSFHVAMDIARTLRQSGVQVLGPCADIAAAEQAMRHAQPHAAVLDVNLERGTSFGLARALARRNIPFVFYTGYDQQTIPSEFAHVRHLQKPADLSRLAEAIAQLLA